MSKTNKKVDAIVIDIPDESAAVAKSRVFRPVNAFKKKLYLITATIYVLVTAGIIALVTFIGIVTYWDDDPDKLEISSEMIRNGALAYLAISVLLIVPIVLLIGPYVNSMSYQVHGTEIVVFKGIINRTEKHVPFRTVTNISSRAGPFDRLFGIGTVFIETAGQSALISGAEERIEGIRVYKEVRDYILRELRKFRTPYAIMTEAEEPVPSLAESSAIVKELREIKAILRQHNER